MAAYDGAIRINTTLNTADFDKGAKNINAGLDNIMRKAARIITIGALVKFGKACIDLASDITEVDNVVSKAFGSMRGEMDEFAANSIKTLGMSRLTAYQTGSTFMSMGKQMLDSAEDAKTMALELTRLTGNMASFYNKGQDLVSLALKSVYTGETETLKQYGIVMTEVNLKEFALSQGIKKKYSEMTQSEKVMLRYNYVLQQTAYIGNDFIDTQDSWANQTRILSEQWKEFMTILGNGLVTVLTPVIQFLNTVVSELIAIGNTIASVLSNVFGIQMQSISAGADDAAESIGGIADAEEEAGTEAEKAGKKASKQLAKFDDLNVLQKKTSGSGSSGGAGGGLSTTTTPVDPNSVKDGTDKFGDLKKAMEKVVEEAERLKDLFTQGFFEGLGDSWQDRLQNIKDNLKSIRDSLQEIFTDPGVVASMQGYMDSVVLNLGRIVGSIASIGLTIAQNLVGGIAKYLEDNKDRIKNYLIEMFDVKAEIWEIAGQLAMAVAYIFEAFGMENGQQVTANIIGIFSDLYMGLHLIILKIQRDLMNIFAKPIIDNKEGLQAAFDDILGVFSEYTGAIKEAIDTFVDSFNDVYDSSISPMLASFAEGFSSLMGTFLDAYNQYIAPFFDYFVAGFNNLLNGQVMLFVQNSIGYIGDLAEMLQAFWENILRPIASWLISTLGPAFQAVWTVAYTVVGIAVSWISGYIDTMITVIRGVITFLTNVFKGDWDAAWGSLWDTMVNVLDTINTHLMNFVGTAWETLQGFASNVTTGVASFLSGIMNGILSFFQYTISNVVSMLSALVGKLLPIGENVMNGFRDGIVNGFTAVKTKITEIANWVIDTVKDLFGVHSPSTVFEEIGVNLLEGLKKGLESAAGLVTSVIGTIVDGILGAFDLSQWSDAGANIINSLTSTIDSFNETWAEGFDEWNENNETNYFGLDKWNENFGYIMQAYTDWWSNFSATWDANMLAWWTNSVSKYFTVEVWQTFGKNMSNGLFTGFKSIVARVSGILNSCIDLFNAAFKELESAMNDLIDSFNENAAKLGVSPLSRMKYNKVNHPQAYVPELANGAVIKGGSPFLAILGDQPAGHTNIEAPLDTIKQALSDVMGNRQSNMTVNLNYDGETFARLALGDIMGEMNRQGYDIDVLTGNA